MPETQVQLPQQPDVAKKNSLALARTSSLIAAAFVLVVTAIMLFSFLREQSINPLTNGTMPALKEQLQKAGDDEKLKEQLQAQIRQEDTQVRKSFFRQRARLHTGAYLLIGGSLILIVAVKLVWRLGAEPYAPIPNSPMRTNPGAVAMRARLAVLAGGAITAGALIMLARSPQWKILAFRSLVPEAQQSSAAPGESATDPHAGHNMASVVAVGPEPAIEAFQKNWPGFRGFGGCGIVNVPAGVEYAKEWDGKSGKNILWKTAVPLPGNNSPVVWDNQVFLTGADAKNREVYCFDAPTGKLVWKQSVPMSAATPAIEVSEDSTGWAPSTMACDGRRIFAIFPAGDVAAFDLAGKKLWIRNIGKPENTYGHAASLLYCAGKLFVQFDQGAKPEDGKSSLLALDPANGQTLWQIKRPVEASWSTPIYVPAAAGAGDGIIITAGQPWAIAHDAKTGAIIWQAKCLGGAEVAPSPVYANGVVYVTSERADLSAIKADGKGDITKTHISWKFPDDLPDIVSPLATADMVFLVTTSGMLTCVNTKDGKALWSQEVKADGFNASPSLVGSVLYVTDTNGLTHLIAADAKAFSELGKAALGEEVKASMAFANGKIFIRGKQNLYCIGSK